MNVAELIEKLKQFPPELPVVYKTVYNHERCLEELDDDEVRTLEHHIAQGAYHIYPAPAPVYLVVGE